MPVIKRKAVAVSKIDLFKAKLMKKKLNIFFILTTEIDPF